MNLKEEKWYDIFRVNQNKKKQKLLKFVSKNSFLN